MNRMIKTVAVALACGGAAVAATAATALEKATPVVLKEGSGKTLHIGTKHSVVYFLARGGDCRTTVILEDKQLKYGVAKPARLQVEIAPGKTFHMGTNSPYALELECAPDAKALYIRPIAEVAYTVTN